MGSGISGSGRGVEGSVPSLSQAGRRLASEERRPDRHVRQTSSPRRPWIIGTRQWCRAGLASHHLHNSCASCFIIYLLAAATYYVPEHISMDGELKSRSVRKDQGKLATSNRRFYTTEVLNVDQSSSTIAGVFDDSVRGIFVSRSDTTALSICPDRVSGPTTTRSAASERRSRNVSTSSRCRRAARAPTDAKIAQVPRDNYFASPQ